MLRLNVRGREGFWRSLRGGTAWLEIKKGRWQGVHREEQVCRNCQSGEVEDAHVGHVQSTLI